MYAIRSYYENAGGDTYSVTVNGFVPGDKISYYIQASDLRPATETHPFIGAADPHVFCLENTSGICNAAKTEYIKAYPNPATNVLYLITNNLPEDDYRIELYDQHVITSYSIHYTKLSYNFV